MYKILMVEDDVEEAATLRSHLERYGELHGYEFQITWLKTALDFISENGKYHLVFMDIDLPGISGMEAANLLRAYDQETPLIFVTNLAQYAVKGYEVDALDFMVKPVGYYDFAMRMNRAMKKMEANVGRLLAIQTADGMHVVPLSKIDYVEVMNHDLIYHIAGEEPIRVRGNLTKFEEENADSPMLRISKSCLINMERIDQVKGADIRTLSGDVLHMSRSRKRDAIEAITRYLGGSQ